MEGSVVQCVMPEAVWLREEWSGSQWQGCKGVNWESKEGAPGW